MQEQKKLNKANTAGSEKINNERREIMKGAAAAVIAVGGALLVGMPVQAEERRRARGGNSESSGDLPMVKAGEGMAVSLNYVDDKKNTKDAKLKTERSGVAWDKQHCNNCMLYEKIKGSGGSEVGKCQLFANQSVKGQGWCTSWAKKA